MNMRVRRLWAPVLSTFLVSVSVQLVALRVPELPPWVFFTRNGVSIVLAPLWVLALPFIGALGAWLSLRAGGGNRDRLLTALGSAGLSGGILTLGVPLSMAVEGHFSLRVKLTAYLVYMITWCLVPAILLALGALPWLRYKARGGAKSFESATLDIRRSSLLCAVAVVVVGAVLSASAVDSSGAARSTARTELLFLGTGGGPPLNADRSEPSTLLVVDGRPYLIDCGIGTMRRMLEAGVRSETVRTVFFTHLHADHDLGLADVMGNDFFTLNQAGSSDTIDIYGPPQTRQLVDAAFHYITYGFTAFAAEPGAIRAGLVNGALKSPFDAHEIQRDGAVFQDDKIRVTAAENSHYSLMPAPSNEEMKSYSYRIETPHGVVVFTGDTGPSEAVIRLAAGADVLVSEVQSESNVGRFVKQMGEQNHWPAERTAAFMDHMVREHLIEKDAGDIAAKAHVKSLVLYHYDAANSASYIAEVKKYFTGPVFGSADLTSYCLGVSQAGILEKCER